MMHFGKLLLLNQNQNSKKFPQSINLYQSNQLSAILEKAPSLKMEKVAGANSDSIYTHPDATSKVVDWKLYLAGQSSNSDNLWSNFNIKRVTNNHDTGYELVNKYKRAKTSRKVSMAYSHQ